MNSRRYSLLIAVLCGLSLAMMPPSARAQTNQQAPSQDQQNQGQTNQAQAPQGQQNEEQPAAPIPAYHSPLASAAGGDESDQQAQPMTPDTTPLSGAQVLTLGSVEGNHNYWQPHVDIFESVVSNPEESPNQSGWGTWLSLSGGVDLHRTSGDSDLMLSYLGGGTFSTDSSVGDGVVQQLGVSDKFTLRRWTLSVLDEVSYLPGAGFGFGGLGDGGLSTGGSVGVGSTFGLPGQTALTGFGQTLENAATGEADVNLTPRTSLTFVAGYSLLQYSRSGLLNSTEANFRGGYNYLLTRKDTIAALYTYSALRYSNFNQSIDVHTIQASYGRRVTGRLAFQVAAGPQIAEFRTPIPGSSGSTTTTTNSSTQFDWSLMANAQYQWQRTNLALSYNHGVSAGAGVLGGSVADIASGSITREMSHTFSSGLTAGYSRNHGLAIGSTTPLGQNYDYWFAGASFSHPIGRTLGLTFSYQMQYQNSSNAFCIGTTCGTSLMTQTISVGLGWHEKPLLF